MNYLSWKNYFESNRNHFANIDWDQTANLSAGELSSIRSSIQQFQKGEQSEGKHLFSFAKSFPDPYYLDTMRLFILEEQTHARILGRFMDKEGIPRIKHHWVDGTFRWLRKLAGLENTITVLVTAEIIAKVYYKALGSCTNSELLQQICRQILKDEDQHIAFQAYTLHIFYREKRSFARLFSRNWHRLLMAVTILVVWLHHRKVLQAGGYYFLSFFFETFQVYFDMEKQVRTIPGLQPAWL